MGLLPKIVAILELLKVALKVLLRHPNVSPADPALHVGPEGLNRVGVDVWRDHVLLLTVIDHVMLVTVRRQFIESPRVIGNDP